MKCNTLLLFGAAALFAATCHLNLTDAVEGVIAVGAPCDIFTSNGQLLKRNGFPEIPGSRFRFPTEPRPQP